jgi:hypothetical protein
VGLATTGGLAEISAGVLGTVATWVASTGSRAAGREAQTPRLVGACERQARGFLGGALRCLAVAKAPPKKKKKRFSEAEPTFCKIVCMVIIYLVPLTPRRCR